MRDVTMIGRWATATAFLLYGLPLLGDCMPEVAPEILEIRIERCQTVTEYVQQTTSCIPANSWVARSIREVGGRTSGLVIDATILRRAAANDEGALVAPFVDSAQAERTVLLFASTHDSCDALSGRLLQVLHRPRCCDVMPPQDFSCFFNVDRVEPLKLSRHDCGQR